MKSKDTIIARCIYDDDIDGGGNGDVEIIVVVVHTVVINGICGDYRNIAMARDACDNNL